MKRKHRDNSINDVIVEKNSVFINNKVFKVTKNVLFVQSMY